MGVFTIANDNRPEVSHLLRHIYEPLPAADLDLEVRWGPLSNIFFPFHSFGGLGPKIRGGGGGAPLDPPLTSRIFSVTYVL